MIYSTTEWDLTSLIEKYDNNLINLNPPYQRGDIWSAPSKKRLIESIALKYPLPIFFLYQKPDNTYDMVDGQQRTRTIIGYHKGLFKDLSKKSFDDIESADKEYFLNEYKISVCLISAASEGEIEDFYFRVNKFGTKLNRPEILKAQYGDTVLHGLVQYIADNPQFADLKLFTDSTLNRLSDLDFIGELLALLKFGITDKKLAVDRIYKDTSFNSEAAHELERDFFEILEDIIRFNEIYPLAETRYRQKNDFYTLFNFLIGTRNLQKNTLDYFYKILVIVGPDISPSQENCYAFQQYATNCVSQSNSKNAREERVQFFNELLLNTIEHFNLEISPQSTIEDVLHFYNLGSEDLIQVEEYFVTNIDRLSERTGREIL